MKQGMGVTIIVILTIASTASAVDYCKLCSNHVACGNNGQFLGNCPRDASIVSITSSGISTLLNTHNANRNKIAGGSERGFNRATQMMKLKWDSELAKLAELNVKRCKMQHDGCIKTEKYNIAGQNIYWMGASSHGDINHALANAINSWYSEIKSATQSDIDNCCGGSRFAKIGHFTQVVRDKTVAIGCAASRYTENEWKVTLIACNYSYGNLLGTPVYLSGSTASRCPNGRDSVFTNLCRS